MAITCEQSGNRNAYYGLSTDEKPTENVPNSSGFYEMDTCGIYIYDSSNHQWIQQESGNSGGSEGGGREPVVQSLNVTANGTYNAPSGVDGYDPVTVNVLSTLVEKTITQNGTYDPADDNADGYSSVTVNVAECVVLSGTSAPSANIGNDEDLYVQYYDASADTNHSYGTTEIFRKENGTWVEYSRPITNGEGVHVWTKSTGDNDAAMYVQYGYYDFNAHQFVGSGETGLGQTISVSYADTNGQKLRLNDIVTLGYNTDQQLYWSIYGLVAMTDGTNTWAASQSTPIQSWKYSTNVDYYFWSIAT